MTRVLLCTFPFPAQSPPVQVSHPCEQCPNADRAILDQHASIDRDDPELQSAIRSFAAWFFEGDAREDIARYAAELYTRADHTGTCIPKTILFAYYKGLQFDGESMPPLSATATAALRGEEVESWPAGELRAGETWNALFRDYTARYQ